MREPGGAFTSDQTFLSILALAVAALVQISVTQGPFNPWNVMTGSIILFILASYRITPTLRVPEILALASTWGLTMLMTSGIAIQWLFPKVQRDNNNELPPGFVFWWWLAFTGVAAVVVFWRRRLRRRDSGGY